MKKIFYKIRNKGDKSYCIISGLHLKEEIINWLDGMGLRSEILVSKTEMTEKKFGSLPEYKVNSSQE